MIELEKVTKYYLTKLGKKYVLRDVTFTIPEGRDVAILGPNGAGKSTLLRLLGGIDFPNKGEIRSNKRISWPLALASGFQGSMTGRENVEFVCRVYGNKRIAKTCDFVKDFSEIGDYFELPIKTYSSGMKSRLAFALSMAFDFELYLIDEITSVGDASFRKKCAESMAEKRKNANVVMVSHDMSTLRKQCDMSIVLQNKQLYLFDNVEDGIQQYQS
ncbi:ABC-type polysaccharide/polyol phosphate transport system ATPase component-like protein [Catenovulum agarivorans DS-2]|uniref:ABC-type polysaccharide/polyol phosphate transport system ATPase component-like protein n=1 Tax=Catenovulum agarivorans DS-2 TaxID=1328313 RepID=W7QQX9_9ALTE|nr:ABC transporter ATP-binding protein [Catenovulum agarivorans]EWH10278.1 ABC-type polysaccharide/polyol phosphate transport system ATPase component-like protein [Catenovulum agarivorans DS-2]